MKNSINKGSQKIQEIKTSIAPKIRLLSQYIGNFESILQKY